MTAQQRLESIRKLDELINAKLAERTRLRELATATTAKPMDGMPFTNTGTVNQKIQDIVIKLVMLEEETNALIDKYIDEKQEIVRVIEMLPEREYGVIHRYYIQGMTWEQVAEDIGYCTTQVWRIKKCALEIIDDILWTRYTESLEKV